MLTFAMIRPDLEKAIGASCNETNLSTVRDYVLNGDWPLFLVLRGQDYVGFAILETIPSLKGDWINIVFAHCRDKDGTRFGRKKIEEHAYATGCRGVKVNSVRPGMRRILCNDGYSPRFVEYVKEFE